jgi:signal transduction histidine kinase
VFTGEAQIAGCSARWSGGWSACSAACTTRPTSTRPPRSAGSTSVGLPAALHVHRDGADPRLAHADRRAPAEAGSRSRAPSRAPRPRAGDHARELPRRLRRPHPARRAQREGGPRRLARAHRAPLRQRRRARPRARRRPRRHGVIHLFNREAERVTGYARDEVLGRPLLEILFDDDSLDDSGEHGLTRPRLNATARRFAPPHPTRPPRPLPPADALRSRRSVRTRAGQARDALATSTHAPARRRRRVCMFAIGRDCTDERPCSRAPKQQEKLAAIGTLAAGLAHEIRNPLNGAQLHVTYLKRSSAQRRRRRPARDDRRRHRRDLAARRARPRLPRLRPPEAAAPQARRRAGLLTRVASLTHRRGRLPQHRPSMVLDVPGAALEISGDGAKLEQVVLNLTRNAIEAIADTGSPGRITPRAPPAAHRHHRHRGHRPRRPARQPDLRRVLLDQATGHRPRPVDLLPHRLRPRRRARRRERRPAAPCSASSSRSAAPDRPPRRAPDHRVISGSRCARPCCSWSGPAWNPHAVRHGESIPGADVATRRVVRLRAEARPVVERADVRLVVEHQPEAHARVVARLVVVDVDADRDVARGDRRLATVRPWIVSHCSLSACGSTKYSPFIARSEPTGVSVNSSSSVVVPGSAYALQPYCCVSGCCMHPRISAPGSPLYAGNLPSDGSAGSVTPG